MQYTITPSIIDKLVVRLSTEATTDGYTTISNKFIALKPITWFNFPYQFTKTIDIIKEYQIFLNDAPLQILINNVSVVSWFGYFKKVDLLVKIVERIEAI